MDEQPGMVPQATEVVLPRSRLFNTAVVRREMAQAAASLSIFATGIAEPPSASRQTAEAVEMVEL